MSVKNDFHSNTSNFISSNSRNYCSTDNCNKQTNNSNKQTDLDKKIKDLEKEIQSLKGRSYAADLQAETSYKQELQERKKNNLVVFGLQEDGRDDITQLRALFSNLGADIKVDNTQFFWTGRSLEKCRPLILKLKNQEEKAKILFKAKRLKDNQNWRGVSITHDLTKQQCQAEKVEEIKLQRKAAENNRHLLEKSTKVWKVVGGRGTRRLALRDKETAQN